MLGGKARWEPHKNADCCFKKILEAAPCKTAVAQPIISHLISHPSKMSKTCWKSKDEFISNIFLWTSTHGHTSVGWHAKIYIHQLCADIGCSLEDLPVGMDDKRESKESMLPACLIMMITTTALSSFLYRLLTEDNWKSWVLICTIQTFRHKPLYMQWQQCNLNTLKYFYVCVCQMITTE